MLTRKLPPYTGQAKLANNTIFQDKQALYRTSHIGTIISNQIVLKLTFVLGCCLQFSAYFDYLTPGEHLRFFTSLRMNTKGLNLDQIVDSALKRINLFQYAKR
jgi:ABC-type multidrug transport system ATPase subunit